MKTTNSVDTKKEKLARDRKDADQGEFFFAKVLASDGTSFPRPVFIIGKKEDSNDSKDVIVCSCTKQPSRSSYDKLVQLREPTFVRTNKIYTINKDHLEFKINNRVDEEKLKEIIKSASEAISNKI